MNTTRLTDLDELAQLVRDQNSASYVTEAIGAYRGGAYRAAIISTWIAVSYDIIAKIRELASQGERSAEAFVKELDTAVENSNIVQLQIIEENLLKKAHEEFEFLSDHEQEDLRRLKADRNRCAHPAFISEDALFQPTPELVRVHIVHAVLHLLQHQPVEGKSAIQHIIEDIKRPSYPMDLASTLTYLSSKYLNRAKRALIRNLVIVLVKVLLKNDDPDLRGKEQKVLLSLMAVSQKHSQIYDKEMRSKLPTIVESLNDQQMLMVFRLVGVDNRCWAWISEASRVRIRRIIGLVKNTKAPLDLIIKYSVFDALTIGELKPLLLSLFSDLDESDQPKVIAEWPIPEFVGKAIELYSEARSYRGAEELGKQVILPMAPYFKATDIITILDVVSKNKQIAYASGTPDIIEKFFDLAQDRLEDTKTTWKELIEKLSEDMDPDDHYAYPGLRRKLEEAKVL